MIVAISTSSPQASVALILPTGEVLSARRSAPMAASGACLAMLQELLSQSGHDLASATAFAADLGPGSFTGVRVGVALAKTMAFAFGVPTFGAPAFDLVDAAAAVVLPSKKGEFFVRVPREAPYRTEHAPSGAVGYGPDIDPSTFPDASRFGVLQDRLVPVPPERLVPAYLIEPSISVPKTPYRSAK